MIHAHCMHLDNLTCTKKQTGESFFPEKVYKNPNTSKCLAIILLNNSNGWSIYHILKLN